MDLTAIHRFPDCFFLLSLLLLLLAVLEFELRKVTRLKWEWPPFCLKSVNSRTCFHVVGHCFSSEDLLVALESGIVLLELSH
jgi:hypothetical protein